jgi:hypothetical protein
MEMYLFCPTSSLCHISQKERWKRRIRKSNIKDKEECMWQRWRLTDCLSVIEYRPHGRRNGDPEKGGWVSDKSPSRPPPSPCRELYLWGTREEDMTVVYLHTTCKLNIQETYYKSILAVIIYWPHKLLKALHLLLLL